MAYGAAAVAAARRLVEGQGLGFAAASERLGIPARTLKEWRSRGWAPPRVRSVSVSEEGLAAAQRVLDGGGTQKAAAEAAGVSEGAVLKLLRDGRLRPAPRRPGYYEELLGRLRAALPRIVEEVRRERMNDA